MCKQFGSTERLAQQEAGSLPYKASTNSLLQWRSSVRSAGMVQNAAQVIANFAGSSMRSRDDSPSNYDCRGNSRTQAEIDRRVGSFEYSPEYLSHRRGLHIVS